MRRRRILIGLVLALGLGLAAGAVVMRQSARTSPAKTKKEQTVKIVVMAKRLTRGIKLKASDIRLREWPRRLVTPQFIQNSRRAIGRVVLTNLVPGEPLLKDKLADPGSKEGLSTLIVSGRRAFSITVKDDTGVSGYLLPGSRVDVHVTMMKEVEIGLQKKKKGMVTKTILQNVEVLAAGGVKEAGQKRSRITAPVVTLLLTPQESDRLALAASVGSIWLSMRNPRDRSRVKLRELSVNDLFSKSEQLVSGRAGSPPRTKVPLVVKDKKTTSAALLNQIRERLLRVLPNEKLTVEAIGTGFAISGMVSNKKARKVALDIGEASAPKKMIDNISVENIKPAHAALLNQIRERLLRVLPKEKLTVEAIGTGFAISGMVSNKKAKKVALGIGEASAPKKVVDNISVANVKSAHAALLNQIRERLARVLPKEKLTVEAIGTGFAISGMVSNKKAKKVALDIGEASAPNKVVDNISVEDIKPAHAALLNQIRERLAKVLPKEKLTVEAVGTGFVISGMVTNKKAKKVALDIGEASAPKKVVDNISVENVKPAHAALLNQIRERLAKVLPKEKLTIEAVGTGFVISGVVTNKKAKKVVLGIGEAYAPKKVVDNISVENIKSANVALLNQIRDRLSKVLPKEKFTVETVGKGFAISGMVANKKMKRVALDIVDAYSPEKIVDNISVKEILISRSGRPASSKFVSASLSKGRLGFKGGRTANKGGLSPLIESGRRAFSIIVKDDTGVSGYLLPGSRVDVHVTLKREIEEHESQLEEKVKFGGLGVKTKTVTKTILQDVEVLAAGGVKEAGQRKNRITTPVVTLMLTPLESDRLALAATVGTIWLSMRNPRDRSRTKRRELSVNDLFSVPKRRKKKRIEPRPRAKIRPRLDKKKAPHVVEIIQGSKRTKVEF